MKLSKLIARQSREKVLTTIRAKLRRYEADRAWLQENPQHFTTIKALETIEGLRLWKTALAAVRKVKP